MFVVIFELKSHFQLLCCIVLWQWNYSQ